MMTICVLFGWWLWESMLSRSIGTSARSRYLWKRKDSSSIRLHPRCKPDWVIREIIRLKALMPNGSCREIADTFCRCFAASRGMTVRKTYVSNVLRKPRYDIEEMRRRIRNRKPGEAPINHTWAMDLTGKVDVHGQLHMMLGLIDHGSRRLLTLAALPNKTSFSLLGYLFLAVGKYGKPRFLRTDNESIFTSRLFRWTLATIGICHQRSEVHCPWQNGRIERLFGTLKQKLDQLTLCDPLGLQTALDQFSFWYNAVRPHMHLNGRTPLEVWERRDPQRMRPKRIEFFSAWDGLLTGLHIRG